MKVYELAQVIGGSGDLTESIALYTTAEAALSQIGLGEWETSRTVGGPWHKRVGQSLFIVREREVFVTVPSE